MDDLREYEMLQVQKSRVWKLQSHSRFLNVSGLCFGRQLSCIFLTLTETVRQKISIV